MLHFGDIPRQTLQDLPICPHGTMLPKPATRIDATVIFASAEHRAIASAMDFRYG
jgi:hypothetical protein